MHCLLPSMAISMGSVALSSISVPFSVAFPKIRDDVGGVVKLYKSNLRNGTLSFPQSTSPPIAAEVLTFVSVQLVAAYCEGLEMTRRTSISEEQTLHLHLCKVANYLAQCCPANDREESVGAVVADGHASQKFSVKASSPDSKAARMPATTSAAAGAPAVGSTGGGARSGWGVAMEAPALSCCIELVVGWM